MKNPLFICHTKCTTCHKAAKWLSDNDIDVVVRDIVANNPTHDELQNWCAKSGKAVSSIFNTSGLKYRAMNLKDVVKTGSDQELLSILASDGMLVKRPLLITDDVILVGFKEKEWADKLL